MIEITTYKCEVCGKAFTNENECLAHELKCKTTGLDKNVILADSGGDPIFPIIDWERAIDKAYFVYVVNEEAAKKLWNLFYEYGYSIPADETDSDITYPAFFVYNNRNISWDYFQDIENRYKEFFAIKDDIEANLE